MIHVWDLETYRIEKIFVCVLCYFSWIPGFDSRTNVPSCHGTGLGER